MSGHTTRWWRRVWCRLTLQHRRVATRMVEGTIGMKNVSSPTACPNCLSYTGHRPAVALKRWDDR